MHEDYADMLAPNNPDKFRKWFVKLYEDRFLKVPAPAITHDGTIIFSISFYIANF